MRHMVCIFVLLLAFMVAGCSGGIPYFQPRTLDVTEPNIGVDTIPFYYPGSFAFNTTQALRRKKGKVAEELKVKEEEKKKVAEKIERFRELGEISGMPDPWIPPVPVGSADVPEALRGLPIDNFGYVDWTAALDQGLIRPKGTIVGSEVGGLLDKDILFKINDELMANVLFSHKIHTSLLSCNNCHPAIFKPKKGTNIFNMYDIWKGQYCGRCHGKVAFQPKGFENCQRCHSVKQRGN